MHKKQQRDVSKITHQQVTSVLTETALEVLRKSRAVKSPPKGIDNIFLHGMRWVGRFEWLSWWRHEDSNS